MVSPNVSSAAILSTKSFGLPNSFTSLPASLRLWSIFLNDSVFGNFIYDTGCKEIILDTTFCNENNLKFNSIQSTKLSGIGNTTQSSKLVLDTLKFKTDKKSNFTNQTYLIGLRNFLGQKTDGILCLM